MDNPVIHCHEHKLSALEVCRGEYAPHNVEFATVMEEWT